MKVREVEEWYSEQFERITGESAKPPPSHVLAILEAHARLSTSSLVITSDPRWVERSCRSKSERKAKRLGTLAPPEHKRANRIVYLVKGAN